MAYIEGVRKGDVVLFSTRRGKFEGKVVKIFENGYLKIRYFDNIPRIEYKKDIYMHDIIRKEER